MNVQRDSCCYCCSSSYLFHICTYKANVQFFHTIDLCRCHFVFSRTFFFAITFISYRKLWYRCKNVLPRPTEFWFETACCLLRIKNLKWNEIWIRFGAGIFQCTHSAFIIVSFTKCISEQWSWTTQQRMIDDLKQIENQKNNCVRCRSQLFTALFPSISLAQFAYVWPFGAIQTRKNDCARNITFERKSSFYGLAITMFYGHHLFTFYHLVSTIDTSFVIDLLLLNTENNPNLAVTIRNISNTMCICSADHECSPVCIYKHKLFCLLVSWLYSIYNNNKYTIEYFSSLHLNDASHTL